MCVFVGYTYPAELNDDDEEKLEDDELLDAAARAAAAAAARDPADELACAAAAALAREAAEDLLVPGNVYSFLGCQWAQQTPTNAVSANTATRTEKSITVVVGSVKKLWREWRTKPILHCVYR